MWITKRNSTKNAQQKKYCELLRIQPHIHTLTFQQQQQQLFTNERKRNKKKCLKPGKTQTVK